MQTKPKDKTLAQLETDKALSQLDAWLSTQGDTNGSWMLALLANHIMYERQQEDTPNDGVSRQTIDQKDVFS